MVDSDRAEAVYRAHAAGLIRFATALVGPADAPDVVSAALVNCLGAPAWLQAGDPGAYLYRAVLNQARSAHRASMRRLLREQHTARPEAVIDPELRPDVWAAVAELSLRQRAVTVLTYVDDLTVPEVARRLGISEGSVHRHLGRARSRLRRRLDE